MFLVSQFTFWILYVAVRAWYNKYYVDETLRNDNSWTPNKESLTLTLAAYSIIYYIFLIIFLQGDYCPIPTVMEIAQETETPLPEPDITLPISDFSSALQP